MVNYFCFLNETIGQLPVYCQQSKMGLFRIFIWGTSFFALTIILYTLCLPRIPYHSSQLLASFSTESFKSASNQHNHRQQHDPSMIRLETETSDDLLGLLKNADELNQRTEGYRKHSFNLLISNRIGFHRSLPDVRPSECKNKTYSVQTNESVSIVICFHNEANSTLMRTVHSILTRTNPRYLHEILLINDHSTSKKVFTFCFVLFNCID